MAAGSSPPKLNAILIGATGATGRCLLGTLLRAKEKVQKVTVLTRRKVEKVAAEYGVDVAEEEQQGRLVQHVEDLDTLSDENAKQLCTGGDVFFNCLGTTRSKAGSAEAFRHIDYEIPFRLIKQAKLAGVSHCSLLTSMGSNPNSWFLYTKTKGVMEESTKGEKFAYTSIFRPGLLDRGQVEDSRFFEKVVNRLFRGIPVSVVAEGMMQDALLYIAKEAAASAPEVVMYDNAGIRRLVQDVPTPVKDEAKESAKEVAKEETVKEESPKETEETEKEESAKEKEIEAPKEKEIVSTTVEEETEPVKEEQPAEDKTAKEDEEKEEEKEEEAKESSKEEETVVEELGVKEESTTEESLKDEPSKD